MLDLIPIWDYIRIVIGLNLVPAGYSGELLPSLGRHLGSPRGGGNSPLFLRRAYIRGILVAAVFAIGGMAVVEEEKRPV
jgi:hypothetical protein